MDVLRIQEAEMEETDFIFRDEETLMPGELEEGDSYTGGEIYLGQEA